MTERPEALEACRLIFGPSLIAVYSDKDVRFLDQACLIPEMGEMQFEFSGGFKVQFEVSEWGSVKRS